MYDGQQTDILPGEAELGAIFTLYPNALAVRANAQAVAVFGQQGGKMQLLTFFFGNFFQHQKIHDIAVRPNRSAHLHFGLIGVTV